MTSSDWLFDDQDRASMRLALEEAEAAGGRGEVPVGAVLVHEGHVVARDGNRRQQSKDPSAHAEILVLRAAGAALGDWRFPECTLYVTLEPCAMCISACRQSRIGLVVWGAADDLAGACGSKADLAEDPRFGPPIAHRGGLLAEPCRSILKTFFAKKRNSS